MLQGRNQDARWLDVKKFVLRADLLDGGTLCLGLKV